MSDVKTTEISLIVGDCIECMKIIDDKSIDVVIADPPYKLEMPEKNGVQDLLLRKKIKLVNEEWDKYSLDGYIDFTQDWLTQAFRVIKPSGSVCVFGTYHNIGLVNYVMQKNHWMIINEIAWYKRNAVPNLACRRLTASYETILWAANSKNYRFNYAALKGGEFPEDKLKIADKQMRNVWDIPTNSSENVGHPTQKPIKVYERLLRMTCPENDAIVLDPFAGSGTLAMAAARLDGISKIIMIEKDSTYIEIIKKRIVSR
jgi:site-specific DNA-methyltransferase (adenine-specific)